MQAVNLFKLFVVWIGILVLAIGNGIFHESLLVPVLGPASALMLRGLLLSPLIVGVAYVALPWLRVRRPLSLLGIGMGWLALTLVFEVAFGRWQGKSWDVIIEVYSFTAATSGPWCCW